MKNPKQQTTTIESLSHDGRGIARIDGKVTFIQGALPDEEVLFQYSRIKKDWDEGFLLSVIKPSPQRREPHCPHYSLCGGCSLQHLDESAQIHLKQSHLWELLERFARVKPQQTLAPIKGAHWHYRDKARLSVRYVEKKQKALVGFRERNNPRYITEIEQCPILHKQVHENIVSLKNLIQSLEDKQSIAQVEVAAQTDTVALIFRNLRPLSPADTAALQTYGAECHFTILLQPKGPDSVHCIYPDNSSPLLSYSLPEYGVNFVFHPMDFTQVNASINPLMVQQAVTLLELQPEDRVMDLFCGLGNFSLPMAKFCAQVVGVEGSQTMVERASLNARNNGLTNTTFLAANLDDAQAVASLSKYPCNKLLLDPPRSGALEVVKQMDSLNPSRIVYVSCNPQTLARDTDVLVNHKGYTLVSAGVMDMFPHTAHVEAMALFEK